jgi:2-C-methyl-D-erythritol 2,4-cyclodiphosphate synthase
VRWYKVGGIPTYTYHSTMRLLKRKIMDIRIGHGFDVHALAEGLRLVLCGVEIEHCKGCVAHSDGDVAIHAICDSLLGALALGDIGKLFPDSDPQYKGIDSRKLLKHIIDIVADKGYTVSNIDCTIAMQKPKLRPHIDTMRERLSEVVGIDVDRISVKATTTERLGFEGREEGVSATAVTLLIKA